jgi:nitrate reductase NapAB chaperone NapD
MPISAYVIRCAPADQAGVLRELRALTGTRIGEATELGIPIATDTPSGRAAEEMGERLQQIPGVKSAVLVYHNFEDAADDPTPLPPNFREP